jgi:hypothetical protein
MELRKAFRSPIARSRFNPATPISPNIVSARSAISTKSIRRGGSSAPRRHGRSNVRKPNSDYLQEKVWQPIGAEADATWLLDAEGLELAHFGFNAVLRDYGSDACLPMTAHAKTSRSFQHNG